MRRREFLKLFGAVTAAPLVPLALRLIETGTTGDPSLDEAMLKASLQKAWMETNPVIGLDSAGEIWPLEDLGRIHIEAADVFHEWRYDPLYPRSRVADPDALQAQQRLTAHLPQMVDFYRSEFGDILIKPSRYNRGRN